MRGAKVGGTEVLSGEDTRWRAQDVGVLWLRSGDEVRWKKGDVGLGVEVGKKRQGNWGSMKTHA